MPTIEQVARGKGLQAGAQDLSDWKAMRGSHVTAIKALADVAEVLIVDLQEQRDELLEALHGAVRQLDMAGDCIEKGLYDEALLHVRSLNAQKRAAISRALGENKE